MSRLKGERDALLAAREAREARERELSKGGEDFIPLGGKVRREVTNEELCTVMSLLVIISSI